MEQPGDTEMAEDRRFFMNHIDDFTMQMTVFQKSVSVHKNLLVVDSDWLIGNSVHILDDKLDHDTYERLNSRLQRQQTVIQNNLANKLEVRQQLELLKAIGFLVPFFVTMKKRMKIPDITQLMNPLVGKSIEKSF